MSFLLVFILLIIFTYLSWKDTRWGIFLLIVFLPSYLWRLSFGMWPTTFLELMIGILFFVWLLKDNLYKKINFKFKKDAKNILRKPWPLLLTLWLVISFLAAMTNFSFSSLGLWRAYFLEPTMVFLILIYNIKNKKDLYFIFKGLEVLIFGFFILAILQYFSEWNLSAAYKEPNIKRLTTLYTYPNALALLTAPITSFFMFWWLEAKNKLKKIHLLIVAVLGLSLSFFAVSEGAILAIGASLLFYFILAKKIRKIGIPLVFCGLLSAFIFLPIDNYKQQLFQPELNLEATSLEIRSNQWQETTWMLHDNFFWGAGINGYQGAMQNYRQYDWIETYLYPHNIFLNFWTELGLLGLFLFLLILFYLAKALQKIFAAKNIFAWPLTLAWLTWFVHGLVDVPYFKNDLSVLFFILLGITLIVGSSKEN